jgi:hypothetical protein
VFCDEVDIIVGKAVLSTRAALATKIYLWKEVFSRKEGCNSKAIFDQEMEKKWKALLLFIPDVCLN